MWLPPHTQDVQATYQYGERLLFRIAGERPTPPPGLTLTVNANGQTFEFAATPRTDGNTFEAVVTVTPEQIRLGPVGTVAYWWRFADGEQTNVFTLAYQDDVLPWEMTDSGHQVYVVAGRPVTGERVSRMVDDAILRGEETLGVGYTGRMRVWVYPNTQTLAQTLERHNIRSTDWIGAYALPAEGVMLVTEENIEADIQHEAAHVMLGAALGEAYIHVPGWLNEGVALTLQQGGTPGALDEPLPLEGLCSHSLSGYTASDAERAYAQSESVVRYIMATTPPGTIPSLIDAYAEGATCSEGVEQTLGRPFEQFERDWLRWQTSAQPAAAWSPAWLVLIGMMMGLGALFFGPQLRR
jgi:hypothetical protein